ncbi:hypothetical protein ANCDUO_17642, partial [Ancylostoma duodenale]
LPCLDSPAVPPSAAAHELFRGFSFVSPAVVEEKKDEKKVRTIPTAKTHSITDDYILKEVSTGGRGLLIMFCLKCMMKAHIARSGNDSICARSGDEWQLSLSVYISADIVCLLARSDL